MSNEVLVLLGSASDMKITEKGLDLLKKLDTSFQLRVASAHRTPDHVYELVKDFDANGGKVILCVAGKSAKACAWNSCFYSRNSRF